MRPWLLLGLALASLAGCGDRNRDSAGADPGGGAVASGTPVEVWVLSDNPLLEIGVRDGEEPYEFDQAGGSVLLDDGRIVVANGGTQELRYFDDDGSYLFSVGAEGEGPGEFRRPTRLRKAGNDTLLVWDQGLRRISFFHPDGEFLGVAALTPTRQEMFPGDDWLFEHFFIESPVPPAAREPIRRAVRAMPQIASPGHPVFLKVTRQGRIWAAEARPPADSALSWTIYDLKGSPVAQAITPPRFEPQEIGLDYVLGRFMDELDVDYIRLYALERPAGSRPGPGLDWAPSDLEPYPQVVRTAEEEEALAPVKTLMKNLASLEEIHYAEHYGYTVDVESLFSDLDRKMLEGLTVTILFATREGWAAMVTHMKTGVYCALAYGSPTPMGWAGGEIICP